MWQNKIGRLLIVGWVAALVLIGWSPVVLAAEPATRPRYELRVDVAVDLAYLTAVETVQFTNATGATLDRLVFQIPAAHFNGFRLSHAAIDGEPVAPSVKNTVIEIPLTRPLAAGKTMSALLQFRLDLPVSNGRYGASDGIIALGGWFPILSTFQNGDWRRDGYSDIGDPFFSDLADFEVYLATSVPVVVAATGEIVPLPGEAAPDAGQRRYTWHYRASGVRDFAIGLSANYRVLQDNTAGVPVLIYYLPDRAGAAQICLKRTVESLKWYSEQLGPYPYPALRIVQTGGPQRVHVAQEYPGLYFLWRDVLDESYPDLAILSAHETAHQWFYGAVGNDQFRDPWLDEALTNMVSLDFFRVNYPQEYPDLWARWGDYRNATPINRPLTAFTSGTTYFDQVYKQGATFLRDLRTTIGDTLYDRAIQSYYRANVGRIARPQDFFRAVSEAAPGANLRPLYSRYFDYPFLSAPPLAVSATLPAGDAWSGNVTVPITITGGTPPYTATLTLDGRVSPVTLPTGPLIVATSNLTPGQHTLVLTVLDDGIGRGEVREQFTILASTPTPSATLRASPIPTPTLLPSPQPTPSLIASERGRAGILFISILVVIGGIALLVSLVIGQRSA